MQISHGNMVGCVRSYDKIIGFPFGGRIVSYLPMAHVAERNVSQYLPMMLGFNVTDCPDAAPGGAVPARGEAAWFFAVPRIWEKMKAGLEAMLAGLDDEPQKEAMQGALDLSLKRVKLIQAGEEVPAELEEQWKQADEQVLANVRAMLGLDQVEACNVGAAPTPPEVIEFFHALGVPLAELWGMSETCGAGTCNPPEKIKIGTVGPPAPDCEIKLDEDGEVLIRGPVVMPGYRNLPEKTAEAFTDDGFLRTGDIGEFDEDGYLKIVDRKKELIISAAGKNMSPANIESKIKAAGPLIGQAVTIGDARQFNSALVTLDPDAIPGLAEKVGASPDAAELAGNEKVIAGRPGGDRRGQRAARAGGADQEVQDPAHRVGARRGGADADHEAQAQADRREVQGRDRRALQLAARPDGSPPRVAKAPPPGGLPPPLGSLAGRAHRTETPPIGFATSTKETKMTRTATTKLVATALAVASLGLASTAQAADQSIAIGEPTPGSRSPLRPPTRPRSPATQDDGPQPRSRLRPRRAQEQLDQERFDRYCNMKDAEPSHSDKTFCEDFARPHGSTTGVRALGGTGPDRHGTRRSAPATEPDDSYKETKPADQKVQKADKGSLPFTGLEIWQLGLIGIVLAGGGFGARRLLAS